MCRAAGWEQEHEGFQDKWMGERRLQQDAPEAIDRNKAVLQVKWILELHSRAVHIGKEYLATAAHDQ